MIVRLKKVYCTILTPAIVGFILTHLAPNSQGALYLQEQEQAVIAPSIFILAALFALAGPIFYRSCFAQRQRNLYEVSHAVLFKFERNLIGMALVSPYLALAADFLQLPYFYLTGTLLMALYAIYYYYPSKKRIAFDMKIFRTADLLPDDSIHRRYGNGVSHNGS
jgi:hypothetical protein